MTPLPNESSLLVNRDNRGVVTLTLNRPGHYNAISEAMLEALEQAIASIEGDDAIRAIVLAANGSAFCTGHDLKEMRSHFDQSYYTQLFHRSSNLMVRLLRLPLPVIAKVQGIATANGCNLVATCDLAIATSDARFGVTGINLGLFCSTPSVGLSRNLSRKAAFEMLVTGRLITADEAQKYGLVNTVVAATGLDQAVDELVSRILRQPATAISIGKRMFYQQLEKNLDDAYDYASNTMACNMMTEDAVEGLTAFIEKRPPAWRQ